jgi:hypothetical protein
MRASDVSHSHTVESCATIEIAFTNKPRLNV